MGKYDTLPTTNDNLENTYTAQNQTDVSSEDGTMVEQDGNNEYAIHQFNNYISFTGPVRINSTIQSTTASSSSTVYLQIYNQTTSLWETIDSDNSTAADTNISLTAYIPDVADYKDVNSDVFCRIYQYIS
jgi:hypothetical protein